MTSFKLLDKIGQGSYSCVYKAINEQTQNIVAIKIINFKDAPRDYILSRQIRILKECYHPNIAPLLEYSITQKSAFLVFEYFPMNLNQYYQSYQDVHHKNLDQNQIRNIMIQICAGISYLHSKGIIHRDIKPQNVMINPNTQEVKLIDFGFSKYLSKLPCTGYMVTRWYRPLQIVLGLPYDEKVDIFAAGAVFLQLIHGKQIFQSASNLDQLYLLLNICGMPDPSSKQAHILQKLNITTTYAKPQLINLTENIRDSVKEILSSMLSNNPLQRPSIDRVLQHLMLISNPTINNQRNNCVQLRRRVGSVGNRLTVVSISYQSRSKSKRIQGDQGKDVSKGYPKVDVRRQIHSNFCSIVQ